MNSPPPNSQQKRSRLVNSDQAIIHAFAPLDGRALGVAVGVWTGLVIMLGTAFLLLKGGESIGTNLSLLGQYFIGYSVTWGGSILGALYGFVFGFVLGWAIATLRNICVAAYIHSASLKANMSSINDFIDNP